MSRLWAFSALATAGALWGTGFAFAAIALVPLTWQSARGTRVDDRDIWTFLIAAPLGFTGSSSFSSRACGGRRSRTPSLMVGVLAALLGAGAAVLGEKVTPRGWGALGASVVGASLIALGAAAAESPQNDDT